MNLNFFDNRRVVPFHVLLSSIGKLSYVFERSTIRFLTRTRSFTNVSFSFHDLTLCATRELISRSLKIQRNGTFTLNANYRRCQHRTNDKTSAGHQSIQLSMLRNVMGNRTYHSSTTETISMWVSVLIEVFYFRRGRLNGSTINGNVVSKTTRRSSTIFRRTKVGVVTPFALHHLFSSGQCVRVYRGWRLQEVHFPS